MTTRWGWMLTRVMRRLWVRATLIGILGVATAVLAAVVQRYVPWEIPGTIRADAVDSILAIIASSMLTVTTFSLSVMVSAYGSATSNVTPRATRLLMEDRVTQNVLSTFIGSFLFSIVGIVVLKTGAYGDRGRAILFVVTIGIIVLIVVSLLRWIDHLTRLGRVGETTSRVEQAAKRAIEQRLQEPYLGGVPLWDPGREVPASATPVYAQAIGYIQHIDMEALARCGQTLDADVFVPLNPGAFVYPDSVLAWVGPHAAGDDPQPAHDGLLAAFAIGDERDFDQDPRFGLAVMSEIGSRAMSAAVNDTGTAIDVIGRAARLLGAWAQGGRKIADADVTYPRVHVAPLLTADLFEDAFLPLARDGAGLIEVQLRLRKSLFALARMGDADFRAAALHQAEVALLRAEAALTLDAERARLREVTHAPPGVRPAA
ncbi:Predicted membrane protein (DUF2254) [Bordetella ansorpii]|uniref:Predicted membrane protein (DUF2254) n=1 Tax=Bordetella ansorpii TaxID=288768 RepID=A0A157SMI0_9BORD|nr:DUF2254 domain-containing protein [Bordetella ansorpii]SAI71595.1 Predicted membrane protein (DUF2254) [Bordetella ansorpii]